jgi:hypothetical protein
VLLGFVKYFWCDTISRLKNDQKAILVTRLNSIDVSGLSCPAISGKTYVQYAGSLTGSSFWVIVQVAPFVLYDLVPAECYEAWLALCDLIPLIWQPKITNLNNYIVSYYRLANPKANNSIRKQWKRPSIAFWIARRAGLLNGLTSQNFT